MAIGMGFPFPWESHGNENKIPVLEWEWEGMENAVYGNGNDPSSIGKKSHGFFCCCRLAVDLSSLYSSYYTTV